jgi:hypothetical protein
MRLSVMSIAFTCEADSFGYFLQNAEVCATEQHGGQGEGENSSLDRFSEFIARNQSLERFSEFVIHCVAVTGMLA